MLASAALTEARLFVPTPHKKYEHRDILRLEASRCFEAKNFEKSTAHRNEKNTVSCILPACTDDPIFWRPKFTLKHNE